MKTSKKILALALAAMMLIASASFSFAATNDPNMTAYNWGFTVISNVSGSTSNADLQAVPADAFYTPTYFDSASDAADVDWSIAATSSGLSGVSLTGVATGVSFATGQYYSNQNVTIPASASGVASFLATNPYSIPDSDAPVNITLVVTNTGNPDNAGTTIGSPIYQIFEPKGGVTILHSATVGTTDASLNTDSRSYVTALDGLKKAKNVGVINDYTESGGYVSEIKVNGSTYTENYGTGTGWQYRVYELSGSDYVLVPLSELVSAGDFALDEGHLVQWRFGVYGTVTFPGSFPNPGTDIF